MTVEVIRLTIGPAPDGGDRLPGFQYAWLMYIWGFRPHDHCQKSLVGERDAEFFQAAHPGRRIAGRTFQLRPPARTRHIYLCAEAAAPDSGLHWVLAPAPGETARTITYNGVTLTATNARPLEIPPVPEGYLGLSRRYTTCLNWRFGAAYYGVAGLDPAKLPENERRNYRPA